MPNLIKKRRKKGSKVFPSSTSHNVTPSTSTLTSPEQSSVAIERIDWALQIASIVKDISEGSHLLAPLKATCALLIRALEISRDALRNESDWNTIVDSLEKQHNAMETVVEKVQQHDRRPNAEIQVACTKYMEVIQEVLAEALTPMKSSKPSMSERFSFIKNRLPVASNRERIAELNKKMDRAFEEFFDLALSFMSLEVTEFAFLAADVHNQLVEAINDSRQSEYAEDFDRDSLPRLLYGLDLPLCLPGTRVTLLEDIRDWSKDGLTKEQIYWLNDAAGTGKTTVSATLAQDWLIDNRLAGRFFFTPNSIATSGISQFCVMVARDIAKQVPSLEATITQALKTSPSTHYGFHQQFRRLILEPLQSLTPSSPLMLVVDAVDNCDPDGREDLLTCMLEYLPTMSHVKVLITSRPNLDIISILWDSTLVRGREVQLLDINDTTLTDIRVYIGNTLSKFSVDQREQVVGYSNGLFIVAATACKLLRWNAEPAKLLNKLIGAEKKDHLDELYLEVLRQAVSDPAAHDMMMNVLQIIIVALQPVSINTIRAFLPMNVEVDAFVQDLGAVLKDGNPDRPIKVLHPTFREFLAESDRANGFLVDALSSHALTAIGCLSTLENSLYCDLLKLRRERHVVPRNVAVQDLSSRLIAETSAAVRYASSYWPYHVAASLDHVEIRDKAIDFLSNKLLNWLELMSLRGDLGDCVKGLSQLQTTVLQALRGQRQMSGKSEFSAVSYAYQFLLRHQPMVQESALHVYCSALAFTPESNPIFQKYRSMHASTMPRVISSTPVEWSGHNVLSGHSAGLQQVEFSPDGTRLASTSEDLSLILWDTASGATVGHPFKAELRDSIEWFAFSPDSQRLVFATRSSKIRIWSAITGKGLGPVIHGDPGNVVQVAFVFDWRRVLSATAKPEYGSYTSSHSLQLWDASNGQKVGESMQLDGYPRSFAVSPDGSRVVCVSGRGYEEENVGAVTLWDLQSFTRVAEFDMPLVYHLIYTSYSPKGDRFVTWDELGALYLRDGVSGDHISRTDGHRDGVMEATFSPNGKILASRGRDDPIIMLWNAVTGSLDFSLSGHTNTVSSFSFSQDNARLASISFDQTVRVWDTLTGQSTNSFFDGYTGDIYFGIMSTDWTKLATVTLSYQINLHDSDAGTMHGNENIEEELSLNFAAPAVAFSPAGDVMVCGYLDLNDISKMDLWNVETCTPVGVPMTAHHRGIVSVSFSSDGRRVASVSEDHTVRLWDGSTGSPVGPALPIQDGRHVTFSPDSKFVASSGFRETKVWGVHIGECVWSIPHNTKTCTFSASSTLLAGECGEKLCLWDFSSGSIAPVISSVDDIGFNDLAFGPTDGLLASSSFTSIQLWSVTDKLQLLAEIPIISNSGCHPGISSDSRFLAYGWLVWDISSPHSPASVKEAAQFLDHKSFPHSLLAYEEGWIYSASPPGPLMPVPHELWDRFSDWHAHGNKIVIWTHKRTPIVIDCEPLLACR